MVVTGAGRGAGADATGAGATATGAEAGAATGADAAGAAVRAATGAELLVLPLTDAPDTAGPAAAGAAAGWWTITTTCRGGVVATTGWLTGAVAVGADRFSAAMRLNSAVPLRPAATMRLVAAGCRRRRERAGGPDLACERRGAASEVGVSHRRGRGWWSPIRGRVVVPRARCPSRRPGCR